MNLLCPNCSKMLTVPEQYAGQLMKCPLCNGTFTVPALPPGGSLDAPAPPAPPPSAPLQPAFSQTSSPDPYHLQQSPAFDPAPPQPAFQTSPPPPTGTQTSGPSQPPPPVTPGDYTGGFRLVANEKILQWVAPAALLLVFILEFFPWIGVYAGSVPVATQGAWSAAFGVQPTANKHLKPFFEFTTDAKLEDVNKDKKGENLIKDNRPGVSVLLIFYLLLFLVTLPVTVVVVALPFIQVPLPPQIQQLLPWKWAVVAGLNAILLLFLALQMLLSFGLESSVAAYVNSLPQIKSPSENTEEDYTEAMRTRQIDMVQRTFWLKFVFLLHIIATAAAALVFWVEKRGPGAPPPALELRW